MAIEQTPDGIRVVLIGDDEYYKFEEEYNDRPDDRISSLYEIVIKDVPSLTQFPGWICSLPALKTITIENTGISYFLNPPFDPPFYKLANTLESFTLSKCKIKNFRGINFATNVKLVNFTINNNALVELPLGIEKWEDLQLFNISNNPTLSNVPWYLPKEFGSLKQLKTLLASNCGIAGTEDTLGGCYHLETIDFSNNKITTLPNCIPILAGLSLRKADFRNNLIIAAECRLIKETMAKFFPDLEILLDELP